MKDIFPSLTGNKAIKDGVGHDILAGSQSHAYIIEGARGTGKHTLAKLIAASVLCENKDSQAMPLPCGVCLNCKKILRDISPDIVYISRGSKASIGVEQIRELRAGLYVTPNDSDMRIYIIESAEKMTVQAQNALLLSLEEPPSFVMFLLLTADSAKLLETIRSRAQTIRMEVFDSQKTASYLESTERGKKEKQKNPEKFYAAVSASGGALGYAEELLFSDERSSEAISVRNTAVEFVNLICSENSAGMFEFVNSEFPKNSESIREVLILSEYAVRDILTLKKCRKSKLIFYVDKDTPENIANKISALKLTQLYSCIMETILKLEGNISSKSCMTELVLQSYKILTGR